MSETPNAGAWLKRSAPTWWMAAAMLLLAALPAGFSAIWHGGQGEGGGVGGGGGGLLPGDAALVGLGDGGEDAEDQAPLPAGRVWLRQAMDWEAAGEAVLWVDARRRDVFEAEALPGAVWLSEDDWSAGYLDFLSRWEDGVRVVVYCDGAGCEASDAVAERLRGDGFEAVYVLEGGWDAWRAWTRAREGR